MPLDRNAILNSPDLPIETVEIPEWGGSVMVRGLTAAERDSFESSLFEGKGKNRKEKFENLRARLITRTLVDENGNRIFQDSDADILGKKSAGAIDRIFNVAQKLSGISQQDVNELVQD